MHSLVRDTTTVAVRSLNTSAVKNNIPADASMTNIGLPRTRSHLLTTIDRLSGPGWTFILPRCGQLARIDCAIAGPFLDKLPVERAGRSCSFRSPVRRTGSRHAEISSRALIRNGFTDLSTDKRPLQQQQHYQSQTNDLVQDASPRVSVASSGLPPSFSTLSTKCDLLCRIPGIR